MTRTCAADSVMTHAPCFEQTPLAVASRKSADILSGGFDRERRCPQRIDVHAQRVPFQHLVVEVARRPRRVGELIEVANVLTRVLEDSRTVFIPGPLVSCNYRARLQRFDFVERSDPFASLLRIGLGEQLVNTV